MLTTFYTTLQKIDKALYNFTKRFKLYKILQNFTKLYTIIQHATKRYKTQHSSTQCYNTLQDIFF